MADERLGDYVARLEGERFVGRRTVRATVERMLAGTSELRILYLHGPGGVGKSALLRAVVRDAEAAGRPVVRIDGRLVAPTREAIRSAVEPGSVDGAVIVVDEADEVTALRVELRDAILEMVPVSGIVVLAGRAAPDRSWFDGALQGLASSVALRPLDRDESRALLARRDVTDPETVERLIRWSDGYPLALTLASSLTSTADPADAHGEHPGTPRPLEEVLLERLGGQELAGVDPDVLDVASISVAVDGPLLAGVLPGRPTRQGLASLREVSISEPLGSRTTLHPLARTALRTRLRASDPDRHRALVLRIAAHLHRRAQAGDPSAALELGSLVEDPELRLGAERSPTFYADIPRPGDVEALAAFTGAGASAWFRRYARWCEERPGQTIAVRRVDGTLSGMSVICMADAVPDWAHDDIESGPVLRLLREEGILDEAAITQDTVILCDPDDVATRAEVVRVGNAGSMALGAVTNPRYVFATADANTNHRHIAPLLYTEVETLRRRDDERELLTLATDFGPGGIVGQIHRLIRSEQGETAPADDATVGADDTALVAALRRFHDDEALAASPLAPSAGSISVRAEAVRATVRAGVDAAFGNTPNDELLRRAIVRTYLDLDGGHGIAQRELHMSRSSFYRHLQRARERLAASPLTEV